MFVSHADCQLHKPIQCQLRALTGPKYQFPLRLWHQDRAYDPNSKRSLAQIFFFYKQITRNFRTTLVWFSQFQLNQIKIMRKKFQNKMKQYSTCVFWFCFSDFTRETLSIARQIIEIISIVGMKKIQKFDVKKMTEKKKINSVYNVMSGEISCKTSTRTLARAENKRRRKKATTTITNMNHIFIGYLSHFHSLARVLSLFLSAFSAFYFSSRASLSVCCLATIVYIFSHSTEYSKIAFSSRYWK